jgi:HAD superfamily hydrolase (TIGR01509 family)
MIHALIFDFDGLILDTETPDYAAWQEIFDEHGGSLSIHDWGRIIGGNGAEDFDPVAELEKQMGKKLDRMALEARWRKRSDELLSRETILPGVREILDAARELGLHLVIASSSQHSWVDGHLKRLGIWDHFDRVICRDDVSRTKPDPELFLKALEVLDVGADDALVFEDSPNGIHAARSAGIRVVGVPNATTGQLPMPRAALVLNSLADLSLRDLLVHFNVTIRIEMPADIHGIHQVNRSAFPTEVEANLVDLLREHGKASLSLVAVDGERVLGHVMFSPVELEPEAPRLRGVGLGPVAVLPEKQGLRLGSRLIETGLDICRERGVDFTVLLGDPHYYSRFGFLPASEFGLDNDYEAGPEFQARELKPGALKGVHACVHYAPEFNEAGC